MPSQKPDPEMLDEDAPEADAAWFEQARPAAEVLPALMGAVKVAELLRPRRGRPPVAERKAHVNIRLDADVLSSFKRTGAGWQTRINQALREWLAKQP